MCFVDLPVRVASVPHVHKQLTINILEYNGPLFTACPCGVPAIPRAVAARSSARATASDCSQDSKHTVTSINKSLSSIQHLTSSLCIHPPHPTTQTTNDVRSPPWHERSPRSLRYLSLSGLSCRTVLLGALGLGPDPWALALPPSPPSAFRLRRLPPSAFRLPPSASATRMRST